MSDAHEQILLADLTWTGGRFARDVAVHVDAGGTIARVAPAGEDDRRRATRLERRALLPGMVYAHSHAFQRELRNRPERFDTGHGSFWTWRDTMYRLVDELTPDSFHDICRRCFAEMLRAGVTTVGEFHYLHHGGAGDWAFDDAILAAARDAGIRVRLLQCFYATGGIGKPLAGAQRRFDAVSHDAFNAQLERLASKLDPTQSLAVACHSIRAASIEDIATLYERAHAMDVPFHIHVEEQRQEIADCVAAHGVGPLRLMLEKLPIDGRFTAIHCTHSDADDLRELFARGGGACLCPSTEGNLADGLPKLDVMRSGGGRIAIGSDCNLRLCMAEDLRWLEYAHRLVNERSGNVVDADGRVAPALFEMATINGAGALRLPIGSIEQGKLADFITLDLNHPSLIGADADSLMHVFVFGCGNDPIDQVSVAGRRLKSLPFSPRS
jgi:formimidoylglutamate deiminase